MLLWANRYFLRGLKRFGRAAIGKIVDVGVVTVTHKSLTFMRYVRIFIVSEPLTSDFNSMVRRAVLTSGFISVSKDVHRS